MKTCTNCNGRGWNYNMMLNEFKCHVCQGTGKVEKKEGKARHV